MRIVRKYERRVMAIYVFEQYILLAVLASRHELRLLTPRSVVDAGLGLAHNLHIEARM